MLGRYWKALPQEERERWEKEAVAAQAEHRRKYPDWRFRPGANAKFRIKGPSTATRRQRTSHDRSKESDGEVERQSRTREKGKGKAKTKERSAVDEEERLEKIAELLVDGKKGRELEIAVEEWEDGRKRRSVLGLSNREQPSDVGVDSTLKVAGSGSGEAIQNRIRGEDSKDPGPKDAPPEDSSRDSNSPPISDPSEFGKMPLTHWFKRSQSEPASISGILSAETASPLSSMGSSALPIGRTAMSVVALSADTDERPSSRDLECAVPSQDSWWSSHIASGFDTDTTGLGYESIHLGSFDPDHISRFQAPVLDSPSDGSAAISWTKTSGGYVAALADPLLDDKRGTEVQSTPSAPDDLNPLSPNDLQSTPIIYPRDPQPPSSFSSLAGWAGSISGSGMPNENKPNMYSLSDSSYSLHYYGEW